MTAIELSGDSISHTGDTLLRRTPSAIAEVAIDYGKVLQHLGLNPADPKAQALVLVCRQYQLDPVLKHAILISEGKKGEANLYVTHKGLLHVAHRSGQLDSIGVVEQGETDTHYTAVAEVWRLDRQRPFRYPGRYPKMRPVYEWSGPDGNRKKVKVGEEVHPYGPEMAIKAAECMALRRAFDVALPVAEERWDVGSPELDREITEMSGSGERDRRSEGLTGRATTGPDPTTGTAGGAGAVTAGDSRPTGPTGPAGGAGEQPPIEIVIATRYGIDGRVAIDWAVELLNANRGDKAPTTPATLRGLDAPLRRRLLARLDELVDRQLDMEPDGGGVLPDLAADTPASEAGEQHD